MFAVGASQHSAEAIKKHLADLRKCCIVKVLGPLRIELGLPNSITAVISVHECYPEVNIDIAFMKCITKSRGNFVCRNDYIL